MQGTQSCVIDPVVFAAYAGFVTFNVTSITSGMAPLSILAGNHTAGNSTVLSLDRCIFPGSGPHTPIFAGNLVRLGVGSQVLKPGIIFINYEAYNIARGV